MSGQVTFESLLHRCILTHQPWHDRQFLEEDQVQLKAAYLIDEKSPRGTCERLERMWCVPKGNLRLNSPMNMVPLRTDWHKGLDNGGWVLLPQCSELVAILSALIHGLEEAAKLIPWTKDGKLNYQRFTYMFVPLDDRSRTIPIGTRKLKDENGTTITQGGTDDDIEFLDPSRGFLVHSLAHPFPVIWKAVEMFGVDTPPRSRLSNNPPDHVVAMRTAQLIYSTWDKLLREEDSLNKAKRDDGQNDDGAGATGSQNGPRTGKRKRSKLDEFDPARDHRDVTFVDTESAEPYNTGPRQMGWDIPDDAPTLVSDAHFEPLQKKFSDVRDEDRPIPLYLAPNSGPMKDMLDNYGLDDAEREKIYRERRVKARRIELEAKDGFLDRWFKDDFKPEVDGSVDLDQAVSSAFDFEHGPPLVA